GKTGNKFTFMPSTPMFESGYTHYATGKNLPYLRSMNQTQSSISRFLKLPNTGRVLDRCCPQKPLFVALQRLPGHYSIRNSITLLQNHCQRLSVTSREPSGILGCT